MYYEVKDKVSCKRQHLKLIRKEWNVLNLVPKPLDLRIGLLLGFRVGFCVCVCVVFFFPHGRLLELILTLEG